MERGLGSVEEGLAPTRIGAYRIQRVLGGGTMGVVYAAEHVETGQPVALKRVRLTAQGGLASIRREVQALRRVDHPGVVRILDEGLSDGVPWYAMELLAGHTLRAYNEVILRACPAGSGREPPQLARTLTLYRHLCDPLAFLHGHGFVHRDLTPANVAFRPDGTPVLMDFGFAAQLRAGGERERIVVGGSLMGTCSYMAPEQICGETADARADLYSLGCMLFESLTGEPPFTGATPAEVLQRHLDEPPLPPSRCGVVVPARLDDLVLGLLAKRPSDRIGYATDVMAMLGELGIDGPPSGPAEAHRGYVYRSRLVGRASWLRALDDALERLSGGRGALILFGGESGVGKTRLASEFATRARRAGVRIVTGECTPIGVDETHPTMNALDPFRAFLEEVADVCRESGPAESERLLGRRGGVLALYEPSLASVPGQALQADPVALSGPGARYRLFEDLRETMAALAEKSPLLLVLDDLQWADELSLSFLLSLTTEFLDAHPILVLGMYRTEEAPDALRELVRAAGMRAFTLNRLPPEVVGAMVGEMLALSLPPAELVGAVTRESEGNPFFVAEYLRSAVDEGLLVRDGRRRWVQPAGEHPLGRLPLPSTLRDLIERRLARLPAAAADLIQMAACLGRDFDANLLLTVVDLTTEGASLVQELIQRCVLEESNDGRLRFVHDKLRETIYGVIPLDRRRGFHHLAATALERSVGDATPSYPLLAHHWMQAQVPDKAIEYLDRAGEWALGSAAYREAADFFSRALEIVGGRSDPSRARSDLVRRARWERRLGEALWALGDLSGAAPHFEEAMRCLGQRVPRTRPGWAAAFAVEVLRQVAHLALPSPHRSTIFLDRLALGEAALAAARKTRHHYFAGEAVPTLTYALAATNLAERSAVELPLAETHWQLGYIAGVFRIPSLAQAYFRRARRCAERTGDLEGSAGTLRAEAAYCVGAGRWDQARRAGLSALDLAEAHRDPYEKGMMLTVLAHADFCTGDFAFNRQRSLEILALARHHANRLHEAWGLYTIARNDLAIGRLDAAVALFEEARAILGGERVSDTGSRILCDGLLALAYLRRGDLDAARALSEATTSFVRRVTPTVFTTGHGYAALVEACLGLCEHAQAEAGVVPVADWLRARTALDRLWRYAALFPIGRPAALLHTAGMLRLAGRRLLARWFATRALSVAERLRMPFEGASAHAALARLAPPGTRARETHTTAALRTFAALGCVPYPDPTVDLH